MRRHINEKLISLLSHHHLLSHFISTFSYQSVAFTPLTHSLTHTPSLIINYFALVIISEHPVMLMMLAYWKTIFDH